MATFRKPDFADGCIELRCENKEVSIYGTTLGLKRLADLILKLVDNPKQGHIHLEDYELLTKDSLIGAIAVFDE